MRAFTSRRQIVFGLLLLAILGLTLNTAALAGTETAAKESPCADAPVTSEQAKVIASDYMQELGYNKHVGGSVWHFSLGNSSCVNGQWRIKVDLGPDVSLKEKAQVLVNCQTGEIEDHFASDEKLVTE